METQSSHPVSFLRVQESASSFLSRACASLFSEDARFDEHTTRALTMLSAKPIYSLRYARDPNVAATVIGEMLA